MDLTKVLINDINDFVKEILVYRYHLIWAVLHKWLSTLLILTVCFIIIAVEKKFGVLQNWPQIHSPTRFQNNIIRLSVTRLGACSKSKSIIKIDLVHALGLNSSPKGNIDQAYK